MYILYENEYVILLSFILSDDTPEVSPITSPSRSHSISSPSSSLSSSPRSYGSHHSSAQNSPPSVSSHPPVTHYGLPPSISVTSHQPAGLVVKQPRTLAARKAYDEPLDVSIRRIESERFRGLMIHPYSRPAASNSPVALTSEAPSGVVAVTPQDAPINLEVPKQSGGDNWRYITPPRQQVINNGELTIVPHARAPSPPQDEPVDFSTKSKPSLAVHVKAGPNKSRHGSTSSSSDSSSASPTSSDRHLKSFTSSRELKFAKNLKHLLVEILRKNPTKAKIIIGYLQHVWWRKNGGTGRNRFLDVSKASDGVRQCTAANGQPSQSYVQGGNNTSSGGGGGSSAGGSGGNPGGSAGGSNGGGYGSGSGGSNGGGNGNNGNNRRGGYGFGGGNGNNNNNNNNEDEKESGDGNKSNNSPNNNNMNSVSGVGGVVGGNSILDIGDLDFDDLPTPTASSTANWFSKHPGIDTGKVINGLLNLKSEYPSYPGPGNQVGNGNGAVNLEKLTASDMTGLDNATANLLQMSVPDPSTTFLDIGTDIGGCASLYEDDPFNLEHLLPSNFNMNQLDVLSGNSNSNQSGSMLSNMPHGPHESSVTLTSKNLLGDGSNLQQMPQQQQQHPHELTATSPNNPSSMSNIAGGLTITATSITTNTHNSLSSTHQHQPQHLPSSICASLYPETTISPVMGGHRASNQMGPGQHNIPSHSMAGHPHSNAAAGVNMNANHLRNLEPLPPSSLKAFIKTEPQPINLPHQAGGNVHGQLHPHEMQPLQYIKKETNLEMHPPHHNMNSQFLSGPSGDVPSSSSHRPDMYDRTPGVSPTSMPSPGSPPISSSYKNMGPQGVAAMAIAALANGAPPGHPSLPDRFHFTPQMMMMQGLQSPNMPGTSAGPSSGGGKMRGGPGGPGANRKRSSSSQCKDGDDDLSSVPSLQMRIKILQQRVRF